MAVHLQDVADLAAPPGYSHVAIGTGRTLVATAGAVPLDPDGNVVGPGDYAVQTEQVIRNLLAALEAGGAKAEDVVKTTVFVVGGSHDGQNAVWSAVQGSAIARAPSTLLGVELLGYTGQLVEIEALAIVE
jgi:enamine deaminase RidA (YjgF/YER057c/UK114 family)